MKTLWNAMGPVWAWPVVIALASAIGLVTALLGDGPWDWVSWLCLGSVTGACVWLGWGRGR